MTGPKYAVQIGDGNRAYGRPAVGHRPWILLRESSTGPANTLARPSEVAYIRWFEDDHTRITIEVFTAARELLGYDTVPQGGFMSDGIPVYVAEWMARWGVHGADS